MEVIYIKYFTKEWYLNSQGSQNKMEEAIDSYKIYYSSIKLPEHFRHNLHDSRIISAKQIDNNYFLVIDSSHSCSSFTKILFKKATIIEMDKDIENSSWLYDEVYIKDNQYEFHILLHKCTEDISELRQIIIVAEDVFFE